MSTSNPITCEPGKVPGWLDESGNPTSCVDDNPTPGTPKPEVIEQPQQPTTTAPAEAQQFTQQPQPPAFVDTGISSPGDLSAAIVGGALILAWIAASVGAWLTGRRSTRTRGAHVAR